MNEPPVHRDPVHREPARPDPTAIDLEHLQLLGIFHYIVGGLMMFFSCFLIFHLVFGLLIAFHPEGFGPQPRKVPDEGMNLVFGLMMAAFASVGMLTGWTLGGLTIYSGRCLQKHRRRLFSLVMAGIACLFMPFGTLLGVFTIVVLQRDSVRRLYGE
jgi:hypothetical protein